MEEGYNRLDDTVDDPEDVFIEIVFITRVILIVKLIDKPWTTEAKEVFKLEDSEMLDLRLDTASEDLIFHKACGNKRSQRIIICT